MMRKSLSIRNWESAQKVIREWEAGEKSEIVSVQEAFTRFMADCKARGLGEAQLWKYRLLEREMVERLGMHPVDEIEVSDLDEYRQSWKLAGITARKKIERMRTFFKFCNERGWMEKNPAKFLKPPKSEFAPTLPFTSEEIGRMLAAVDLYPDRPRGRREQLRAFVLVLRHTGLRIGDAVGLSTGQLQDGAIFLRTAKTGSQVRCPIPHGLEDRLSNLRRINERFWFFSGNCNVKSAVADWQRTLTRLFKLAQIKDAFAHRFRDTFATDLLSNGVALENVAVLLGHNDLKITWKHYAPWVRSRQDALEAEVRKAFQ